MSQESTRSDAYDVQSIRADFPILATTMRGKPLVYLDSAASAQKPRAVLDAIQSFYDSGYANIHRGVYQLSAEATEAYEDVREKTARFLGCSDPREIVFTRNVTEAINLVAQSYGRPRLREGDEILISAMEHHANIVPWQLLCEQTGAILRVAPIDDSGELLIEEYEKLLCDRTRIVALTHVSNALGTINPMSELLAMAREHGAATLVDGAQAAPHLPIDVEDLGCDFYGITAHKIFGPTGVGVLRAPYALLESMPPYQGGGDMIEQVTFEKTTYREPPFRFEAGTPNIAGVIGLGAAIDYVSAIGMDRIAAWEHELLGYANERLAEIPELRLIGTARRKAAVLSFVLDGVHPHDIGSLLDMEGIAIRAGHHCAQPLMDRFDVPATARASLSIYNTREDVDALVGALRKTLELFA